MEDFHVDAKSAFLIYRAVRAGGASAWDDNQLLKAAGEKRILKKFPQDPRMTWEDWKNKHDVFK